MAVSLKYTIQEYLLWESRSVPFAPTSIQERGVIPDILLLEHQQDEDKRVDMSPFPALREEDNENVLYATRHKQPAGLIGLWLRYFRTRSDAPTSIGRQAIYSRPRGCASH